MKNTRIIRKGSQVVYRPGFGFQGQQLAEVVSIEVTESPNDKYGDEVDAVHLDSYYILTLNNGHWCYSHQVDGVRVID